MITAGTVRSLLLLLALGVTVLVTVRAHDAATGTRLKNVLFVPIDDQRPCYKSYGDGCVSPAHDRLAKEGMIFTRAFANFAWCAPSRNSFMR